MLDFSSSADDGSAGTTQITMHDRGRLMTSKDLRHTSFLDGIYNFELSDMTILNCRI